MHKGQKHDIRRMLDSQLAVVCSWAGRKRKAWLGSVLFCEKIEGGFCIYLLANYFLFPNKLASFFYFTFIALFLIIYYIERYPIPPRKLPFSSPAGRIYITPILIFDSEKGRMLTPIIYASIKSPPQKNLSLLSLPTSPQYLCNFRRRKK